MNNRKDFKKVIVDKSVPVLILDQKWHQLFDLHGKPAKVRKQEEQLNSLLTRQSHIHQELKDLKKLKKKLLDNIMQNMGGTEEKQDVILTKRLEEDRRLIDEINVKIENYEDELLEIPLKIQEVNNTLMLETMNYCYQEMRNNQKQIRELSQWIAKTRQALKEKIVVKQDYEITNRQMYSYMHDIFGADVIEIFDLKYEDVDAASEEKPKGAEEGK